MRSDGRSEHICTGGSQFYSWMLVNLTTNTTNIFEARYKAKARSGPGTVTVATELW
jgi:hypothetical protein